MCGIAGIVALDRGAVDPALVERALDRLAHRGPDARGIRSGPGFVFGHVRLAIVDPERRGDQPMASDDGATVITFNGEIFNHAALRRTLEAAGRRFRTASDTEVLLHAWQHWGPAAIDRLIGQFAFAVYDRATGHVELVRDRVGIKPLYYAEIDGTVVFASELPAIAAHPGFRRRLDPIGVSSFLSYRHVLGDRTLFAGLHQLRPAHRATVSSAGVRTARYWRIDLSGRDTRSADDRAAELRRVLREAVASQLPAAPPVALLLSGGLDSAILAREAVDLGVGPVVAFTAHIEDADADELPEAAATARHVGVDHVQIDLAESRLLDDAADCVAARGVPLGMHNEVGMHLLARAAASRSKVLLCGEGADELFAGYGRIFRLPYDHRRAWLADRMPARLAGWFRRRVEIPEPAAGRDAQALFESRYTYFPVAEKRALFTAEMQRAAGTDEALSAIIGASFAHGRQRSLFDAVSVVFLEAHLPGLLAMVDGVTMANGVEGRVPFLDERVVQAAYRLPARDRLAWNSPADALGAALEPIRRFSEHRDRTKAVLRRAYARDLPHSLLARKKKGFPVPLARWLGASRLARLEAELCSPTARLREVFDRQRLAGWMRAGAASASDRFGRQLWQLYNLELFLRRWFS